MNEHPRLAALAIEIDEHLEEVDLRQIARVVDERNEYLSTTAPPLGDGAPHGRHADLEAFLAQHAAQASRRESLVSAGPARGLREDRLDACPNVVQHRRGARLRLDANRDWLLQVSAHRVSRDLHLPGD